MGNSDNLQKKTKIERANVWQFLCGTPNYRPQKRSRELMLDGQFLGRLKLCGMANPTSTDFSFSGIIIIIFDVSAILNLIHCFWYNIVRK
jgi:hypothetical protein